MQLPAIRVADGVTKQQQISFGGLNHNIGASDGQLWDMENMTGDYYPVLASRKRRLLYKTLPEGKALFGWEGLAWVEGNDFYFEGEKRATLTAGPKSFAAIGDYIVIFPDKKYFNIDNYQMADMEAHYLTNTVTIKDGEIFGESAKANTIYNDVVDFRNYFKAGDGLTISGCTVHPENNKTIVVREVTEHELRFYEFSFTMSEGETSYAEFGRIGIDRNVPDMMYLCENDNRLWGCDKTTIYASKLGDVTNWNVYDGLSTDSWAVDTGSAGRFTACIAYQGYPTFFKEDHIYRVYGSQPGNYQLMGSECVGIPDGNGKSLAQAGNALYYLSRNGIMGYTGGLPKPAGTAFGDEKYRGGVAGSDGKKYFISQQNQDGTWSLAALDTERGMWHKQDNTRALQFAKHQGNLFMLTADGKIWIVSESDCPPVCDGEEEEMHWCAEFTDFAEQYSSQWQGISQANSKKKGVSKIFLRIELGENSTAQAEMMFDSSGIWEEVHTITQTTAKKSVTLPIVPRRCDHYRIRLSGTGQVRIYSMSREYYAGSDR